MKRFRSISIKGKLRFIILVFTLILLSLSTQVKADDDQSGSPGESKKNPSASVSPQVSSKSEEKNKNRLNYQELVTRIDKYAATVLKNYEKNLKKVDSMLNNTKKYYNNKLSFKTGDNPEIDSLLIDAINAKAKSYQSLSILKLEVDEIKKVKGNGTPGLLHRFERDANYAITTFDEYKIVVGKVITAVKGITTSQKEKKK